MQISWRFQNAPHVTFGDYISPMTY